MIPGVTLDDHGKIIEEDEENTIDEVPPMKHVQESKPKKQEEVNVLSFWSFVLSGLPTVFQ